MAAIFNFTGNLSGRLARSPEPETVPAGGYYTQAETDAAIEAAIAAVVGGASGALDTLKEIEEYLAGAEAGSVARRLAALESGKAEKSEMSVTAGSDATKKTVQLKSGLSQEVLVEHQDVSGKRSVNDLDVRGVPQGEGSWFIVNGEVATWAFSGHWRSPRLEISSNLSGGYDLDVADVHVGSFVLDSAFSSRDIEGYVIVGYVDTLAKESDIPSVDPALSETSENPVQNKVVTKALYTGFTKWEFSGAVYPGEPYEVEIAGPVDGYYTYHLKISDSDMDLASETYPTDDVLSIPFAIGPDDIITATRHLVTPTKTSQLTNDGAPNGGGTPYATTAQIPDVTGKADKTVPSAAGNLAALNAQGNLVDSGAKVSDFAVEAALPYALVAKTPVNGTVTLSDRAVNLVSPTVTALPPVWEWSDGLDHGQPKYGVIYDGGEDYQEYGWGFSGEGGAIVNIDSFGNYYDFAYESDAATELSFYSYETDKTIVASFVTPYETDVSSLAFPSAVPGKVRDFMVRLAMPEHATMFSWPSGVDFETEDGEFPDVSEPGVYLLAFTESSAGSDRFELFCRKVQGVE